MQQQRVSSNNHAPTMIPTSQQLECKDYYIKKFQVISKTVTLPLKIFVTTIIHINIYNKTKKKLVSKFNTT